MGKRIKGFPIGVEDFEEVRTRGLYYVDKTGLIVDLLNRFSKVTLITRPRRFGKTLNMSMLEHFFSIQGDKSIFEGLKIAEERELCSEHMGKYPVLSLSLKSVNADNFETAYQAMSELISRTASRVYRQIEETARQMPLTDRRLLTQESGNWKKEENFFAYESMYSEADKILPACSRVLGAGSLLPEEQEALARLRGGHLDEVQLYDSLYTLAGILRTCYGMKTVVLIDEYDVPLAKAYEHGYYDQMVLLLRNMFERVLKTNENLEFAVLTGCMRISKESIFTGLNNLRVLGMEDRHLDEYFGFTDSEVRAMLAYSAVPGKYASVRDWYDGYQFGNVNVYCPWDVINFCDSLLDDPDAEPQSYWMNSSGNSIVRELIEYSGNATVRDEIERLINGEAIEKHIRRDLTYPEMYASVDNLWSVLYTTGYLTQKKSVKEKTGSGRMRLVIPNLEVKAIFAEQILSLFEENLKKDGETLSTICDALQNQNIPRLETCLNDFLNQTISIRDTAVRSTLKENFYHGLLAGALSGRDYWNVRTNQESGDGYSDIIVRDQFSTLAIVIEIKYAEDGNLSAACEDALKQIEEKRYAAPLYAEKRSPVLKYGIAFHLKQAKVMQAAKQMP